MSRTSHVPYHQNLFDLLNVVRWTPSTESAHRIEAWEAATHAVFPAAMREFYTNSVTILLSDGQEWTLTLPDLWSEYSNDEQANTTEEVLEHRARPEMRWGSDDIEPGPYFWVMTENQGNWRMYLRLMGEDDPLTYVTEGELYFLCPTEIYRENLHWCCLRRFTDVLFDWFRWYYLETDFVPLRFNSYEADPELTRFAPPKPYRNGLWLRTPAEPFAPPVIDFLTEQFGEPERTPRPGNVTTYTFRPSGYVIRITADEPHLRGALSAWWIHAETPARLAELARLVVPFGTLSQTLRADTDPAREVWRSLT